MAVGLYPPDQLPCIEGIRLSAVSAGIYKRTRPDLALIELAEGSNCSAVFTKNSFAAAPVQIAKDHIAKSNTRYCLVNAGNANAGTGLSGMDGGRSTCNELARLSHCTTENVLPFSTGVIGEPFPTETICRALPELYANLQADAWLDAARAIMTTDTVPKAVSKTVVIDNIEIKINGIAKGAGMIRPDMATMLAFIATDARVDKGVLDRLLTVSAGKSFNRVCVDGDTSTNDACVLIATGKAFNNEVNSINTGSYETLSNAISDVCSELAQSIVRDGEGATKFITIDVEGGKTADECLAVGYAVATSPLVKTAFFASDPNWGRILAAVGRSGIENLSIEGVCLYLNGVKIVEGGGRCITYTEEAGLEAMKNNEITVRIVLDRGDFSETLWTCDLSQEYVRINAEYRS